MRIRMKATGQVEDFDPTFARRVIEAGMAESLETPVKPGMPGNGTETAAMQPPAQTAALGRPHFHLGPRSGR